MDETEEPIPLTVTDPPGGNPATARTVEHAPPAAGHNIPVTTTPAALITALAWTRPTRPARP